MSRIIIAQYTSLPEDVAKTIIDEIYKRYREKTVYVGRGVSGRGLFKTKTLSYMVGGFLDNLCIEHRAFGGNGDKSHYFIKQKSNIEITKIIL